MFDEGSSGVRAEEEKDREGQDSALHQCRQARVSQCGAGDD